MILIRKKRARYADQYKCADFECIWNAQNCFFIREFEIKTAEREITSNILEAMQKNAS